MRISYLSLSFIFLFSASSKPVPIPPNPRLSAVALALALGAGGYAWFTKKRRPTPCTVRMYVERPFNHMPVNATLVMLDRRAMRAGAIADAMAAPFEFLGHNKKGFYRDNPEAPVYEGDVYFLADVLDFKKCAILPVSDDTIMSEVTLSALRKWQWTPTRDRSLDKLMTLIADATLKNYEERDTPGSYSWADSHRAPGNQCITAILDYKKTRQWDRRLLQSRAVGLEAGCGRCMDSFIFGVVTDSVTDGARLAIEHACLSHPDIVSQAACAAIAAAAGVGRIHSVRAYEFVDAMIYWAGRVSDKNKEQELKEWRLSQKFWPKWRKNDSNKPYTVEQRIYDVVADVKRGTPLDAILLQQGGWGAPGLVGAVVAILMYAEKNRWTVKDAVLAVINADCKPGEIDRDSVASCAAQLLAYLHMPMGFKEDDFARIEGDSDRARFNDGEGDPAYEIRLLA